MIPQSDGSCLAAVEDLTTTAWALIAYYNRTVAQPFKWTYQGKPLVA